MSAERVALPASRRPRHRVRTTLRYTVLVVMAVIVLFPIVVTIINSLLKPDQIAARPPRLFPDDPQWHSYSTAMDAGKLRLYLRNSFVVAGLITVAQVMTAVFAAYAFAFLRFPLKRTLFVVFLATLMVSGEVTLIINRQTVVALGWFNSYAALIVPFMASGFGAFLLRQAFLTVPQDLRDAAALDGYGHWRFMFRVVVPLARPAIGALSVFSFLLAWNQYLWPLIVTESDSVRTVQIGLRQLRATSIDQINVTFAGTVIAALPIFVLLVLFQKQLVRGLTAGAVKG
ncbi:MAG TPA: carbohydrate ABC transporter permease [Acidimicrobiales bacterium]|nr:carbohydrate ABC transporter permease [Acidimicrobiales bacterium]